jgi:hypothetical protein
LRIPKNIDKEVIPVYKLLNSFPGVTTYASCSGHSFDDCYIAFICSNFKSLKKIVDAVYASRVQGCPPKLKYLWTIGMEPLYTYNGYEPLDNGIRLSIRWENPCTNPKCYECQKLQKVETEQAWRTLKEEIK